MFIAHDDFSFEGSFVSCEDGASILANSLWLLVIVESFKLSLETCHVTKDIYVSLTFLAEARSLFCCLFRLLSPPAANAFTGRYFHLGMGIS